MSTSPMPSKALTKRANPSTALINGPSLEPPVKRIKRPTEVLEEEEYEAGLEHIIRRDFFPGLAETEAKRQYMLAVESGDSDWIFEAKTRLRAVQAMGAAGKKAREEAAAEELGTPVSRLRATAGDTPRHWRSGETPRTAVGGQTPAVSQNGDSAASKVDTSLGLSEFQHKYTSEDNESFYKLLDKSNNARVAKHAYLWSGTNKLKTPRELEEARRKKLITDGRAAETAINGRELARIKVDDNRPAAPEGWKARPDNNFMFAPEGVEDTHGSEQQRREARSRMGEKAIVVENTRMPPPPRPSRRHSDSSSVPPSPSLSAVRAAIRGHPRPSSSMAGSTVDDGSATPRVNGWAFVDSEEPEPEPEHATHKRSKRRNSNSSSDDNIDLGPGDATPNPFRIRAAPSREAVHDRMLERMAKNKLDKRLDAVKDRTPIPRFVSSPHVARDGMSPAARRLLGSFTPRRSPRVGSGSGSSGSGTGSRGVLGDAWAVRDGGVGVMGGKVALPGVTPVRKK